MRDVLKGYKDANIPLEAIWNDIDIYDLYKDFTSDENTFPVSGMKRLIADLHAENQYYVPIVDSNIYAPNPNNVSDAYPPFERGAALGTFIRDPTTADSTTATIGQVSPLGPIGSFRHRSLGGLTSYCLGGTAFHSMESGSISVRQHLFVLDLAAMAV
jgi:hypothetical protein